MNYAYSWSNMIDPIWLNDHGSVASFFISHARVQMDFFHIVISCNTFHDINLNGMSVAIG